MQKNGIKESKNFHNQTQKFSRFRINNDAFILDPGLSLLGSLKTSLKIKNILNL